MSTLASLVAEIGADDAGFESTLVDVVHGIDKIERKFQHVRKSSEKVQEAFAMIGSKSEAHSKIAVRGLSRLQGKLSVVGKTAYNTGDAIQKGTGFGTVAMGKLGQEALMTAGSMSRLGGIAASMGGPIGIAVAVVAALTVGIGLLAAAITTKLVRAFAFAAAESAKETAILQGLEQALHRTGNKAAAAAAADFNEFASELQRTSRFADDMIVKAASLGVAMGIPHHRLKEVTRTAADFATRTGKSLEDAFNGIAKAANGQGRILLEAGFKVDSARLKAEGLDYVLGLLNAKMGGAAAQSVQNYEGRINALSMTYGDLIEGIGGFIEKSPLVNAIIVEITNVIAKLAKKFSEMQPTLTRWLENGLWVFAQFAKAAAWTVDQVALFFLDFVRALAVVATGITGFVKLILDAFADLLAGIGKAARFLGWDTMADGAESAAESIKSTMLSMEDAVSTFAVAANDMWKDIASGKKGAVAALNDFLTKVENTRAKIAKMSASDGKGGDPAGGGSTPESLARLQKMIGRMQQSGMVGKLGGEQVSPMTKALTDFSLQFGRSANEFEKSVIGFGVKTKEFLTNLPKQGAAGGAMAGALSVGMGALNQGNLGGIMGGAKEGAALGGPMGAAAGAIMAMITQSKQFAKIMTMLNEFLQVVADTLGSILEPIIPIFKELFSSLSPLLKILSMLIPIITKLSVGLLILNVMVKALTSVAKVLFGVFRAVGLMILRAIKSVYKAIGKSTRKINDQIDNLKDMKFTDTMDELADAASAAADGLTNVPEGFKYALRKFQSMDPEDGNFVDPVEPPGGSSGGGSSTVDVFKDGTGVVESIFDPMNGYLQDILGAVQDLGTVLGAQEGTGTGGFGTGEFPDGQDFAHNIANVFSTGIDNLVNAATLAFAVGPNVGQTGGVTGQGATSGDAPPSNTFGDIIIQGATLDTMDKLMKSIEEATNRQVQRKHGGIKPVKR